jgi:hypothetical protein
MTPARAVKKKMIMTHSMPAKRMTPARAVKMTPARVVKKKMMMMTHSMAADAQAPRSGEKMTWSRGWKWESTEQHQSRRLSQSRWHP